MSEPFKDLEAVAVPIEMANVDTDQIIPLHRLAMHRLGQSDLGESFFYNHRFEDSGAERPGFVLNMREYQGAQILVAQENFGCGSSREAAVTAMKDFGVRCVVAPSFGDIFFANCAQNGVLAIRLPYETCLTIRNEIAKSPGTQIRVDLREQTINIPGSKTLDFDVDPLTKEFLLEGINEFEFTMRHLSMIEQWEKRMEQQEPWSTIEKKAN